MKHDATLSIGNSSGAKETGYAQHTAKKDRRTTLHILMATSLSMHKTPPTPSLRSVPSGSADPSGSAAENTEHIPRGDGSCDACARAAGAAAGHWVRKGPSNPPRRARRGVAASHPPRSRPRNGSTPAMPLQKRVHRSTPRKPTTAPRHGRLSVHLEPKPHKTGVGHPPAVWPVHAIGPAAIRGRSRSRNPEPVGPMISPARPARPSGQTKTGRGYSLPARWPTKDMIPLDGPSAWRQTGSDRSPNAPSAHPPVLRYAECPPCGSHLLGSHPPTQSPCPNRLAMILPGNERNHAHPPTRPANRERIPRTIVAPRYTTGRFSFRRG
jgi:hypothetical protein